jgi:UDP-N-acetyl-D-mannosaminuronic acid transferase (WecB/TagA/CpsF family)
VEKLLSRYPKLNIVEATHGYGDMDQKISLVISRDPHVVLIDMKAPRREAFLLALREAGFRGLAISCSGFFRNYIRGTLFSPAWPDRWHLRFAYRLYSNPRVYLPYYLIDYPLFFFSAIRAYASNLAKQSKATNPIAP